MAARPGKTERAAPMEQPFTISAKSKWGDQSQRPRLDWRALFPQLRSLPGESHQRDLLFNLLGTERLSLFYRLRCGHILSLQEFCVSRFTAT